MKTSELIGPALDWAVAKCEGEETFVHKGRLETRWTNNGWKPSTDWAQGGPIIEREGIDVQQVFGGGCEGSLSHPVGWQAIRYVRGGTINPKRYIAQTPLIAAMRCYVTSKMGDEVEIPQELQPCQQPKT
jgi:hypothetical protein